MILTDRPHDPHLESCCMEDGVVLGSELVGGAGGKGWVHLRCRTLMFWF